MSSIDQHQNFVYSPVLTVQQGGYVQHVFGGEGPHPHVHGFRAHHRSLLLFIYSLCTLFPTFSIYFFTPRYGSCPSSPWPFCQLPSRLDHRLHISCSFSPSSSSSSSFSPISLSNNYDFPGPSMVESEALSLSIELLGVIFAGVVLLMGSQPPRYYVWVLITFIFTTGYIILTATYGWEALFTQNYGSPQNGGWLSILQKVLMCISFFLLGFTGLLSQLFLAWGTRADHSGFWFGMMGAVFELRIAGAPLLVCWGGFNTPSLKVTFIVFIVILNFLVLLVACNQRDLQATLRRLYDHYNHTDHLISSPSSSFWRKDLLLIYVIVLSQSFALLKRWITGFGFEFHLIDSNIYAITLLLPIFLPIIINASFIPRIVSRHNWKRVAFLGNLLLFLSVPAGIGSVNMFLGNPLALIGGAFAYSSLLAMLRNLNPGKPLVRSYLLFFFLAQLGNFSSSLFVLLQQVEFSWFVVPAVLFIVNSIILRFVGDAANGPKLV